MITFCEQLFGCGENCRQTALKCIILHKSSLARELSAKLTEGVKLSRRKRPAAHDFPCPLRSKGEAVCRRRGLFLPLFVMCNLEKGNGLRRITFLFVQKSNQKTHLEGWLTRPKIIGLAAERNCALRACFNGATLPSKNSRGRGSQTRCGSNKLFAQGRKTRGER